ncbi:TPA: glycosyltransferase family 88 protein [Legionella feeleii]
MTYNFNPHRDIKIWLSKNPASFLNLENRARLIKMPATNPTDEINSIYESSLLSAQALKDLDIFCKKYQIVPKDVQKDVIPNCTTAEEKNLIKNYQDQITNLDAGGLVFICF